MVFCQVTLSKIVQANILSLVHATIDRFRKCCNSHVLPVWSQSSLKSNLICLLPPSFTLLAVHISKMGGACFTRAQHCQKMATIFRMNRHCFIPIHVSHAHTHTYTHTPSPGTVSDDMADAIVNFKQSTEYKCDKLGYLSTPVGKVRIHCSMLLFFL